jgi:hypothetical protein
MGDLMVRAVACFTLDCGGIRMTDDLVKRLNAYLTGGGLFNPELANHEAVRDLIIDCRDALERLSQQAEPWGEVIESGGTLIASSSKHGCKPLPVGTLIYAAPPADEAVRLLKRARWYVKQEKDACIIACREDPDYCCVDTLTAIDAYLAKAKC